MRDTMLENGGIEEEKIQQELNSLKSTSDSDNDTTDADIEKLVQQRLNNMSETIPWIQLKCNDTNPILFF